MQHSGGLHSRHSDTVWSDGKFLEVENIWECLQLLSITGIPQPQHNVTTSYHHAKWVSDTQNSVQQPQYMPRIFRISKMIKSYGYHSV